VVASVIFFFVAEFSPFSYLLSMINFFINDHGDDFF